MVINIFNAVSFFNGEEDTLEHDRGLVIDLEDGSVTHCLKVDNWIHNYTIITHKDKDGIETEITIGSIDNLDNDELIEMRKVYGYKEIVGNEEDEHDDYSGEYKSKFD